MNPLRTIRNWRSYRRTVNELNGLPDRLLADIGIPRGSIREFARKRG